MDTGGEGSAEQELQQNNQVEDQRDVEVEDTPGTPQSLPPHNHDAEERAAKILSMFKLPKDTSM